MSIILFFAVLAVLILSHEFGHFIVAKRAGIRVDEFAFGFPPRLFKFRKGETLYSFNLIPFGGFVKIHGEEGNPPAGGGDPRSFASKSAGIRASVIASGVIFNLILAWILLSIGFMVGLPTSPDPFVAEPEIVIAKFPWHAAFWEGIKATVKFTGAIAVGIFYFIKDAILGLADFSQIMGPVGIVGVTGEAAKLGFGYLLAFTALLSINLAIINSLPFPALDGGRLLFLAIEKIKGSPINYKFSSIVHAVGLAVLLILMLAITYKDIMKLI